MDRAERRRRMRVAGLKRAEGKKGRRPQIRVGAGPMVTEDGYQAGSLPALTAAGFRLVTAEDLLRT